MGADIIYLTPKGLDPEVAMISINLLRGRYLARPSETHLVKIMEVAAMVGPALAEDMAARCTRLRANAATAQIMTWVREAWAEDDLLLVPTSPTAH